MYILIVVVTFRVTRFVITDRMPIGALRERVINWWEPDDEYVIAYHARTGVGPQSHWGWFGGSLRYLFSCPWCMSIWVGPAVIYVFHLYVSVPLPIAVWLGASALTGLLANLEDKLSS